MGALLDSSNSGCFSDSCLAFKEHLRVAPILCASEHQQSLQEKGSEAGRRVGGVRARRLQLQQLQQRAEE